MPAGSGPCVFDVDVLRAFSWLMAEAISTQHSAFSPRAFWTEGMQSRRAGWACPAVVCGVSLRTLRPLRSILLLLVLLLILAVLAILAIQITQLPNYQLTHLPNS